MEDWKRRQWVVKPDLLSLAFTLCFSFHCFALCRCVFVNVSLFLYFTLSIACLEFV